MLKKNVRRSVKKKKKKMQHIKWQETLFGQKT